MQEPGISNQTKILVAPSTEPYNEKKTPSKYFQKIQLLPLIPNTVVSKRNLLALELRSQ